MQALSTGYSQQERKAIHEKSRKNLLWLGIFSIIMVFGGFTSYYVVSMGKRGWISIELPQAFWISSAIILVSSLTMNFGQSAVKKGNNRVASWWILATLVLGISFAAFQYSGWMTMIDNGLFFAGPTFSASIGMVYVVSFVHLVHLVFGLGALGVTFTKARMGRYSPDNFLGVQLCSIYWHFLDGLWIYLFLFLTFFK
ncbi:MAG: cytochrome c oxidase subunit III [Bacteroidetes bacterium]|nr:MAG: cytochrome c oxidase subunit III [Bacteroidota bacterium]